MKPLFAMVITIAFSSAGWAGVSYEFRSVTTGAGAGTVSGHVSAEGAAFRLDVRSGDGVVLKSGSSIVSRDGRLLQVIDPPSKSFYDLDLNGLLGGIGAMLGGGGLAQLSLVNVKTSARDEGSGGLLERYPTRHSSSTLDCDVVIDAMGQKMTAHVHSSAQRWTTDRIERRYIEVLQLQGLKSGLPEVDRLLAAESTSLTGFPLKQLTTLQIVSALTGKLNQTTTTTITGVAMRAFPALMFSIPAGFRKAQSPVQRLSGGARAPKHP